MIMEILLYVHGMITMTFVKTSKTKHKYCRPAISRRVDSFALDFWYEVSLFHIFEECEILKGGYSLLGGRRNVIFSLFWEAKVDFANSVNWLFCQNNAKVITI